MIDKQATVRYQCPYCEQWRWTRPYDLHHSKSGGRCFNCCQCTHGDRRKARKTAIYQAWQSMRNRCLNPNSEDYRDYGGRGIQICKRWDSYENFKADMGERPSPKHSLDRRDNNGNYTPKNCRWATVSQQNSNRRFSRR